MWNKGPDFNFPFLCCMQAGILGQYIRRVISATNSVHSGTEERAIKALAVVAKMIERMNLYAQMLSEHKVTEQARGEVEMAMGETLGLEVEVAAFSKAEGAFLAVLKAKVDLLNAAENAQKKLFEDLEKEKISHQVDVENAYKAKSDMEEERRGRIWELEEQLSAFEVMKLRDENQWLSLDLEKFKKGYTNAKQVVYDAVGKAKEKAKESFAEGFCLA